MTSMSQWTPDQWAVFTVTVAAGLIAAAVLAVLHLRWTPPAPLRVRGPAPRPSITMTERRAIATQHAPGWAIEAAYVDTLTPMWVDPMAADFTDPGIGALASIRATLTDPALKTSTELQAEESLWINAYADLRYFMPETDAERERVRIALEPAMRTARKWLAQAGEGGAGRRGLSDWRMNTDTGEWPLHGALVLMAP